MSIVGGNCNFPNNNRERERERERTQTTNKRSSKVKKQRLMIASRLVVKTDYFAISIVSVHLLELETAHFCFFSVLERGVSSRERQNCLISEQ